MTVLMYDGINSLAAGIAKAFPNAKKVAGYVNGRYAWSQADWGLFPDADHVTITVTASANEGDVLDCENGDATPDQTGGWIAMRKAAGLYRPTVYCSLYSVPAVRAGTGKYVLGRDYDIWVADYDDSLSSVYPLAAAKQYLSASWADVSVVYDTAWPHRKAPGTPAPPPPPPAPPTAVWPAGVVLRQGDRGGAVRVLQQALHDSGQYGARGLAPVDGIFGAGTETALRNFQHDRHLTVDGIAGEKTRSALGI
jgi:hypothetical protein